MDDQEAQEAPVTEIPVQLDSGIVIEVLQSKNRELNNSNIVLEAVLLQERRENAQLRSLLEEAGKKMDRVTRPVKLKKGQGNGSKA